MRARFINEQQHFERGRGPKKTIGIGGIDLSKDYQNRVDSYRKEVKDLTANYTGNYEVFLTEILVGKTITAELRKMPKVNIKSGLTSGSSQSGNFTIMVKDVVPSWHGDDFLVHLSESSMKNSPPTLIIADPDNNMYSMNINQKIYIE